MATTSRRILAGVAFWTALAITTLVGGAIGLFYNANSDVIHESRAVFQVAPNWKAVGDLSKAEAAQLMKVCRLAHDDRIRSSAEVRECLQVANLFQLDSFIDLSKDECVDLVISSMVVQPIADHGAVYEIVLRSTVPQDSATLSNNLIKHYHDSLKRDFPEIADEILLTCWELARIGEQIHPDIRLTYPIGLCAGFLLASVTWFLINPFRFKLQRVVWWQWLVGLLTACFACGLILVWWTIAEPPFQSAAQVSLIVDEQAALKSGLDPQLETLLQEESHEFLLQRFATIEKACEMNNLFVLDIFIDCSKEEVVRDVIQENLAVQLVDGNSSTLDIQFRAQEPEQCRQVLQTLVDHYIEVVESKYRFAASDEADSRETATASMVAVELVQPASEAVKISQNLKWNGTLRSSPFGRNSLNRPRSQFGVFLILFGRFFGLVPLGLWLCWLYTRDQDDHGPAVGIEIVEAANS